ncbi:MAG: hypothetical protein EXS63_07430 [Candidatus Omnitrophica bacterium]|nr:hypothetical protein [Candidatus Omnitrophota bacterium]
MKTLESTVESQNEVIRQQGTQIEILQHSQQTLGQSSALSTASLPAEAPKAAGLSQGFNPDIGVTGTVQTKLTQDKIDGEGNNAIALKELELDFAHVVDPFSRLDAIIGFNDNIEAQNVDIEEAYYTRWGLPLGFTAQLGKFRSKIGKENLRHLHQLDTADYPLVIQDFFGEEGLASSGARLQNNIPNPWDIPLEITGEVLRGNNGPSFSGISRRPIFNSHLKTFFELTKDTNLELGWTTLFGDENPPQFSQVDKSGEDVNAPASDGRNKYGVKVYGADATFKWFLPEEKVVKFQNELYFQSRGNLVHPNEDPWGFYSLLDYKFSPKFSTGLRFDYLEPLDVIGQHRRTVGISPYITFWQSEFADFKLQYEHLEPANGDDKSDNMIFLQVDFLIGAHKHPVQ